MSAISIALSFSFGLMPPLEETYSDEFLSELTNARKIDIGFVNQSKIKIVKYYIEYKSNDGMVKNTLDTKGRECLKESLMRANATDRGTIQELSITDDKGITYNLVANREIPFRKNETIVLLSSGKVAFADVIPKGK